MLAISLFLRATESGAQYKYGDPLLMLLRNDDKHLCGHMSDGHTGTPVNKTDFRSLSKPQMVPYMRMSAHWEEI